MKILNSLKSILWFVFVAGTLSFGQDLNPADSQFIQSFGIDSINLQNLSLGLNIPIISKPGAIPFSYSLIGKSSCSSLLDGSPPHSYNECGIGLVKVHNQAGFGASWNLSGSTQAEAWQLRGDEIDDTCAADGKPMKTFTRLYVTGPDATSYYLSPTLTFVMESGGSSCAAPIDTYTTQEHIHIVSSPIWPTPYVTATTMSGLVYRSSSIPTLTDTFGSVITNGIASGTVTDTLNSSAFNHSGRSFTTGEVDSYTDTTGTQQQITSVLSGNYTVKTAFGCGAADTTYTGINLLTEMDFPDGNNLHFAYEPISGGTTGRLSQVTLRTGGTIGYSYGSIASCLSLIPSTLTRTTSDGPTTYSFAVFTSGSYHGTTTTAVDPGKNKTVYTFMGTDVNGLPQYMTPLTLTQVQTYQNTGTVAAPVYALLSTTIYCYNGNSTACQTMQAIYPITQKDTYVAPGSKTTYSRVKQTFDTYGNVTSVARYDFTTIGGGIPVTTTTITYGSWNGASCVAIGSGIVNKPCDVTVRDASNNPLSESKYTYGTKGFMTSKSEWGGSVWVTTNASANANGTPAWTQNALGTKTFYGYAATGSGGCNALLPTSTSTTVGTTTLSTGATWDCNGGKLLTATDANNNTSQFTYDMLFRPTSQTDPTTYQVAEFYGAPTTVTVSDPYVSTINTVDGLGRPIRTQTTDGANYDTVSTSYAFNGTQFQVSNSQPCLVAINTDCTKNHFGTVDPLGRYVSSSTTSNETVTTSYNQNDVSTTLGPTTPLQTVQTEYDGLGRVKSVCAIQATGGTSCGQVNGNSGIRTAYAYSSASWSQTTSATRGSQVHTTVVDSLGRAASSTTPEAGTVTNYYDTAVCASSSASTGNLTCSVGADGTNTIYFYDAVGRLTDVNAIGNGNCRRMRYDASGNGIANPPAGATFENVIGRLIEVSTDNCSLPITPITDEWFSYDKNGRITEVWESTPHSGGYYHTTAAYYLNGDLNTFSGVPGKSTYTVTLDTEGRPDSSTLGATTLVTNVNYNGANQVTSFAYGSSGGNDAFTFDANGRMKTYTYTVGAATDKGTLTWNTNGSLKALAIVDGLNAGGTQTCNFTYDDLSRLLTDNCGTIWNQSYTYDQYDNFSKSGSSNWNPGYSASNNHITGASYDGNGRVTYDLNNSYSWDGYGKMLSANAGASVGSCGSGGVTCVTYDAFGRPAEKQVAGTFTEFLYSPIGLTATMNGQTTTSLRLPLPGGALLDVTGGTNKLIHYDWLGSARLITNTGATVLLDVAYTPYGEKYTSFGSGTQNFTGDFQDLYAGLFDTPNREFDQAAGSRWLSPDPARASWNAYAYSANPNSMIDPSGLSDCGGCAQTSQNTDPNLTKYRECGISNADGTCYESPSLNALSTGTNTSLVNGSDTAERVFGGGFLFGIKGSDAAWRMVSGTFNAPQVALAQTICGGGVACQIGTGLVLGAAIGGAQGLVSGAGAIESLALNTKPGANSIANFRSVFNTNATFLRGTASDVSPVGAYHTSPLQVAEGGGTGSALFSQYKGTADGMWRISNHWGNQGSTSWFLNNMTGGTYDATSGLWMFDTPVAAFVRYVDMAPRVY
jgi:YD repeat-containing protein